MATAPRLRRAPWPPAEVAQTLGTSVARVYVTKHRVLALLEKGVRRLEKVIEGSLLVRTPKATKT